ncbi:hypothetical protein C8N46_10946 [Kordia periserrulae]|uniref:Uncharacterized protein n=1 Tax=Kordia periserrulae TaxID=701523 RepID=A0A2T6BTP4_9FLAO|nr:hypothetical protein C8N46_10946 [Kordia periserrulae]
MGQFRDISIKNVIEDLNQSYFYLIFKENMFGCVKQKKRKLNNFSIPF